MSKMSDMAMTIKELRNAAAAISEVADWLAEQFSDSIVEAFGDDLLLFRLMPKLQVKVTLRITVNICMTMPERQFFRG